MVRASVILREQKLFSANDINADKPAREGCYNLDTVAESGTDFRLDNKTVNDDLNGMLFILQKGGRIEGLTIEGTQVMEPIMPKLTKEGAAEVEARKAVFANA